MKKCAPNLARTERGEIVYSRLLVGEWAAQRRTRKMRVLVTSRDLGGPGGGGR